MVCGTGAVARAGCCPGRLRDAARGAFLLGAGSGCRGRRVAKCGQQRREAAVADSVAFGAEPGSEGVAGQGTAVPPQLVPCGGSDRKQVTAVGPNWHRFATTQYKA